MPRRQQWAVVLTLLCMLRPRPAPLRCREQQPGVQAQHLPGLFFFYDLSPIKVRAVARCGMFGSPAGGCALEAL